MHEDDAQPPDSSVERRPSNVASIREYVCRFWESLAVRSEVHKHDRAAGPFGFAQGRRDSVTGGTPDPQIPAPRTPNPYTPIRLALVLYLVHLLLAGWIASSQIFLGFAFIATIVAIHRGALQTFYHPLFFPIALYLVASALSAAGSDRPLRSLSEVEWFTFSAFPIGLWLLRAIPSAATASFRTIAITGIFCAGYAAIQFFLLGYGNQELDRRVTGPTAHVMTLSGILLAIGLATAILAVERRETLFITAAIAVNASLLLTFTRSAWLGWIAGAALVIARRRSWKLLWVAPLLLIAVTFSPLAIFGRFVSSFDTKQASNLDRIRMAQAGVEIIKDHPILGVGPGQVKETYPLYRKEDAPRFRVPHLHNNIFQIWAERGFMALAGYFLFIGYTVRELLRNPNPATRVWSDAGLAVITGLTVAGLFEFNFGDSEVVMIMVAILAVAFTSIRAGRIWNETGTEVVGDSVTFPGPDRRMDATER